MHGQQNIKKCLNVDDYVDICSVAVMCYVMDTSILALKSLGSECFGTFFFDSSLYLIDTGFYKPSS